jgi:CRISPR-associated endoribonuclease Cas6
MRTVIATRSRADAAHSTEWGHKFRGRVWDALVDTDFRALHDSDDPSGFVTSVPIPFGDVSEGAIRTVMVASPHDRMLAAIEDDLDATPRLTIGEWDLEVLDVSRAAPDVGTPGTRGVLETVTGVLVSIKPSRRSEYGINRHLSEEQIESGERTFWRPEFGMEPFLTQIENNLDLKHRLFMPDHLPGPADVQGQLFDSFNCFKEFATPMTVAQGVERTLVMTKWRFGYEVRDNDHRRHLNLALDCGIGERNPLGLGFVDRVTNAEGEWIGAVADAKAKAEVS